MAQPKLLNLYQSNQPAMHAMGPNERAFKEVKLLMDEPSLGLSPILVEEVANIIREIKQDGVTIILVEQNARIALELANTAYVLQVGLFSGGRPGRIALHGDAKELANDERVEEAYLGG